MSQFKRAATVDLINNGKYPNAAANTIVETLGYTTKGDGGAGNWRKTGVTGLTASQTPAQLADAKLTDANGHEWAVIVDDDVSFRALGCAGDGSTDDTLPAIAAISAGRLFGKLGDIYSVGVINITSNTSIRDAHFKLRDSIDDDVLSLERNASDVTLTRLVVDGNTANNTAGEGININGSTDVSVTECEVFNTASHGIVAFPGDDNNNRLVIHGNHVHDTDSEGIQCRAIHESRITSNHIQEWGVGFNAIEIQEVSTSNKIDRNTLETTTATLFGIEVTGDDSLTNSSISFNVMKGSFTGISGKISNSTIQGNQWNAGNGSHRSGIEVLGVDNVIQGNNIYDGTIVIASNGANTPSINASMTLIEGNKIRNTGDNQQGIEVGAVSTSTGTPTSNDIQIKNNTLDFSGATGTATRCMLIGEYGNQSTIENIDILNNTIVGPNGVASTEGVRINSLAGSGKVKIKGNTFKDVNKAIRLNNDNITDAFLRNNDANDGITTFLSDGTTTTNIVNVDNDV